MKISFVEGLVATAIGITIISIVPKIYRYIKAKIKGEKIKTDETLKNINSLGFIKYREIYLKSLKKQIKDFNLKKHELFYDFNEPSFLRRSLINENRRQIKKYNILESELFD